MSAVVESYPPEIPYLGDEQLDSLSETYERDRFVYLPHLLDDTQASSLLEMTRDVPSHRVKCGGGNVQWDEQNFEEPHPAYQFFTQDMAVRIIGSLTAKHTVQQLIVWTSGYKRTEYINPHCDNSGTAQLLVCLEAPLSTENGGKLVVTGAELFLRPGDALAFEATTLEHFTTPLTPTEACQDPKRTVLIGRYFLA